jgi:hypothetical protein
MQTILNVPFDEPFGATVAYDYSASRKDITLPAGSEIVRGHSGNALKIASQGFVDSLLSPPFVSGDYAVKFRAQILQGPSNTTKITLLLNGANGSNEIELPALLPITQRSGVIIFVKIGFVLSLYFNGSLIYTSGDTSSTIGTHKGFVILNYNGSGQGGYMQIEDWEIFTGPLDVNELLYAGNVIDFILNRRNFLDWGVRVTGMDGVINNLSPKEPQQKADWPDYHGEVVNLSKTRFQAREITLDCYIKANGKEDFYSKYQEFIQELTKTGTQRLQINLINQTKPFVFEIGPPDGASVKTRWRPEVQYGTFQIKVKEYDPVKRVLKHIRTGEPTKTASITLTSKKMLTIFWGDGTRTDNADGTNVTYTHDYTANDEYFIIIAGVIEEITAFTTNAIVVWTKLS